MKSANHKRGRPHGAHAIQVQKRVHHWFWRVTDWYLPEVTHFCGVASSKSEGERLARQHAKRLRPVGVTEELEAALRNMARRHLWPMAEFNAYTGNPSTL